MQPFDEELKHTRGLLRRLREFSPFGMGIQGLLAKKFSDV